MTGASRGIGRELALLLAERGTRVVMAARGEPELREACLEARARGGRAEVCVLDVTNPRAVRAAIRRWDDRCDGLDLVVANAGHGAARVAHKLRWKDIGPVLQVNVVGAFATVHAAIGPMVRRGHGTIAGISSLAAVRGLPGSGAYGASKAALATFLETLRLDLAPRGITVVDVRPGFVDTAMTKPNRFRMPMLLTPADAARRTLRGIERGKAVVAFPWPTAAMGGLLEVLPDPLYRALLTRRTR